MIGRSISHYLIEDKLGEGGMGTVFLARDSKLGRRVAIKILSPEAAGTARGRLLREARAASSLNHSNIVTIHEIGHAEGIDFIVMEHVGGRTLSREIPEGGLPTSRVIELATQIASALAAAHRAQVVHRDLKPGNVIVTQGGQVKVLDFGLAKTLPSPETGDVDLTRKMETASLSTPGQIMGTVGYMSPEQIQGRPTDARSDVFAMGVLVFEMLTGRRPFVGDSHWAVLAATVEGHAPPVTQLRPETPPDLARIVARCLAVRPEDRYPSGIELAADLARIALGPAPTRLRVRSSPFIVIGAITIGALGLFFLVWSARREARLRWATVTAPAEIDSLHARGDLAGAYQVAKRALAIAPRDAGVKQEWTNLTVTRPITSDPPGAEVAFRSYMGPDSGWVILGHTPLSASIPIGLLRWRLIKAGYDTLEVGQALDQMEFRLVAGDSSRPGMVLVPRGPFELESTVEEVEIPAFWLDRTEVTNRDFKAFLDSGGYRKREYWTVPFAHDGRELSWEEAMSLFKDATGRTGPSTWELGSYPEGQADYPVAGVSWFEAAAYAAHAGKQLPTAYHWYRASGGFGVFSDITRASNFSGKGPSRAAEAVGLGPYGTYDMAGNVKEWCWNAPDPARRYILGGGWNEPDYMFRDQDAQSPFERRATFGFRCMLQEKSISEKLLATIPSFERDISTLRPVSDDIYQAYRRLYDYDAAPLDAQVEGKKDSNPAWLEERVSIRAAYGNERVPIRLFLPKGGHPPYQAIVFFPHSGATRATSSQDLGMELTEFFPRSGRVLVYPIYQGTYERRVPTYRGPNDLRDVMIQRGKDMRRAIDYLFTRADIDSTKIAFYGVSLGAQLGPLFLAIEPRFRAGVFFSGGFETWEIPPECDPVNFTTRVTVPVLMVNGREDFDLPYATAQVPMFNMLATPATDKRHAVFEGGHIPPDPQAAIKVILDWLDTYLGPVN